MSDQFLNSHKLATISEFRYLLLEVLDRSDPISWYDLSFTCKELSLNFAFAFENSMAFLQLTSLVNVHIDRSVSRVNENFEGLSSDQDFAMFILQRTLAYLKNKKRLEDVFNDKTILLDPNSDLILIELDKFPADLFFVQALLINLGVIVPAKNENNKWMISDTYKMYLREELFSKVLKNMPPKPITPAGPIAPSKIPTLFISYAFDDVSFKNELQKHLSGLKMLNLIRDWEGRAILPGQDWEDEIRQKLEEAEVVLFLVSSDFMASEYINDVEIKKTIERHLEGKVRIIPIILRPCDFDSLPIKRYQALPDRARAISLWPNQDEAYLNIVNRIKEVIKQLSNQSNYSS